MAKKSAEKVEELQNVYFVYGDEEMMVEEALERLKGILATQVDADFNMEVLDASEVGVDHVIDSAETIPLLSPRRLVIARNVDRLTQRDQSTLAEYLDRPNEATTLVLVAHIPKAGEQRDQKALKKVEGSALCKKAGERGRVLKFTMGTRGRQQKVTDWVSDQFKRRGKRIEPAARDLLIENVGVELRDLQDAVERVCLYSADFDVIKIEQVSQVVRPAADQGVFDLIDAVAERRRDISLYLLNRLVQQGESPQRLFSLLLGQFRLIARCKSLASEHAPDEIAGILGVPQFRAGKALRQSRRFSAERLRAVFGEFAGAQVELHSSRYLDDRDYQTHVMEMLIVKVIG
ncbi:MAG: DNA polymerase III subunit delta [Actinobacteria bacterium]|nr:DNA polymerase III subunit delta [Actinomycetota bacterium]MBU1943548.1 DNA polymerase III subunit delta [Actinomycetota bacterium]MBU2687557.1 DNA polymerase III subunit delta [Actinomycetota bacterium]